MSVKAKVNNVEFEFTGKYGGLKAQFTFSTNFDMLKKIDLTWEINGDRKGGKLEINYSGLKKGNFGISGNLAKPAFDLNLKASYADHLIQFKIGGNIGKRIF